MLGAGELGRAWGEMRQELELIATVRITGWCNNYAQVSNGLQQAVQMNELLKENERLRMANNQMQSQLQGQSEVAPAEETEVVKVENPN